MPMVLAQPRSDGLAGADPTILIEIIQAQTEIAKLGLDLGGVIAFVAERVQQLTGAGGAIVELAEGDDMVYRAAAGMAHSQLGLRLQRQGSMSGLCVERGQPLQCDDSETDPRVDREACRRVGLRSMVCAPLNHNGATVGVLKIASPVANGFSERHVQILGLMSDLIAAAMFHAVQYETSELYHKATHDALTGLANRALFYDRLRQCVALARRKSGQVGILNLDMDGLKPINDQMGHRAGDAAIREIALRISRGSRKADTVARLGGDEFGVILPEVMDRDSAASLAQRIAEEIRLPFHFEDKPVPLDASIGMAVFPDDGAEIETLIESADKAMYAVKLTCKVHR
jgi:diguanylate cyclase (GGDEF)-like protein